MANPYRPRLPAGAAASEVEVSAGIDDEVLERRQFAPRHVHGQTLGNAAEIQYKRAQQRDGLLIFVQLDVAVTHFGTRSGALHPAAGAMLDVEAPPLHGSPYRGIERAATFFCDLDGKTDGFENNRTDADG